MNDVFGEAILDYQLGKCKEDIITSTSISDDEPLKVSYLFRTFDDMPLLEQTALNMAKGTILDIGCGAGSHSLFLQEKGFEIKSIDISPKAIACCRLRGLQNVDVLNVLNETESYDTLLLLMNGSGIFKSLEQTPRVLSHLKTLLNKNGQILVDSSDIKYMYEDEDGGFWVDAHSAYYGELEYDYMGICILFIIVLHYFSFSSKRTQYAAKLLHNLAKKIQKMQGDEKQSQ